MKKFIILIPVYNDWKSLGKLLNEINISIQSMKEIQFKCLIINDASTESALEIQVPSNIHSIELINMKKNRGHTRCNAFGIRNVANNTNCNHLIIMDGDGEDRPEEIKELVERALNNPNISIVAKRVKRSEGVLFRALYQMHKVITYVFTGKNMNFGHYSCLTINDVKTLSSKSSLWGNFSGSVKLHIKKLKSINSIRGVRYYGPSKMSLLKLLIHSFSIIAVFKKVVFLRSVFLILISSYFVQKINLLVITFQVSLVLFNLLIYVVSLRENEEDLLNSGKNEKNRTNYTH